MRVPVRRWAQTDGISSDGHHSLLALAAALALCGCQERATEPLPRDLVEEIGERITFGPGELPRVRIAPNVERQIASVLNISEQMEYGDFVWKDDGIPEGRVWLLVDLKGQTISVFRGANEIGTAVTLYGVDEKPTPVGRFTVLAKLKDHQSSIYDAEMPYTLRLTDDGIAIHGSDVRQGMGTHGCLGIPLEFATLLFQQVKKGDEVLILRDAAIDFRSPGRSPQPHVS